MIETDRPQAAILRYDLFRLGLWALPVILLLVSSPAGAEDSALQKVIDVDLAAQPLGDAVLELERQSDVQIVVGSTEVEGRMAPAVRGRMSVGAALAELLEGTDLGAYPTGTRSIGIGPRQNDETPALQTGAAPPAAEPPAPIQRRVVEEIVVTANRRTQNVQDVASGIRVFGGEELERQNAEGFQDYIFKVPGVDVADSGLEKKISIRGIGNGGSSPVAVGGTASPIGIYLNDIPIQGNGVLPDLGLYDLERIEVLKGPQGTLYGEGAQGGAIKMLLAKADPGELSAKADVSIGQTRYGGGLNHGQDAAVNVPLFGSWAARLVGSRRENRGFVDFPDRGTTDENDETSLMGRVHLDGEIWEGFSVSTMVLHQSLRMDQFPQVQKSEGDLRNHDSEDQFQDVDFTLVGLTLDYDLGFAELTSSTSWFRNDRRVFARLPFISLLVGLFAGGDSSVAPEAVDNEWVEIEGHQFSIAQELRLVSRGGEWIDWIAGAFYRRRDNEWPFVLNNDGPCCPEPAGSGSGGLGVERFEQFAGFGELTVDLPWSLELVAGLRVFRETASLDGESFAGGPTYFTAFALGPDGDETTGSGRFGISTTEATPRVSLTWRPEDDRMVYALVANGVRSGGTNVNSLTATGVAPLFAPDSLWTYELGTKTQWLGGRLTLNLALFHNEWKDLQVLTTQDAQLSGIPVSLAATLNVGGAFSRGAELELAGTPLEGLDLGMTLAVMEGAITRGDPAGSVPDGAALPQLSRFSYAASADYEIGEWSFLGLTPFAHFDSQRVGSRNMAPGSSTGAPGMAGFQLYNAMLGVLGDQWDVTFGIRNLTDARPELGASLFEPDTKTVGRPRTWTAKVAFRF